MRITSAGNVGIGTTSPSAKLDVNGSMEIAGNLDINTLNPRIAVISGAGNITLGDDDNVFLSTSTSAKVGIGTTTPATKLDVNGSAGFNSIERIGPNSNNPENGMWNPIYTSIAAGRALYADEEFAN